MISNPNNATIRQIRKLRKRRDRDRRRRLIIEGHRALSVALASKADVTQVVHTPAAIGKRDELLREARAKGSQILEVTPVVMASLSSVETAPDVLGVVSMPEATVAEAIGRLGLGAVLAGIKDPATAGSILSSCAAAGGVAAIATKGTTDLFAPKAMRAGAGAHYVLSVANDVPLEECGRALRDAGVRILAVHADGPAIAIQHVAGPVAIVIAGDEGVPELLEGEPVGPGTRSDVVRPSIAAEAAVVLFEAARRGAEGVAGTTG